MALPTCPKCTGTVFELQPYSPRGGVFKLNLINCTNCGCVVGAKDFFNTGALLAEQNKALKAIAAALRVHVDFQA